MIPPDHGSAHAGARMTAEPYLCLGCQKPIRGRVVWLAEDYRNEGGDIDGPYALHPRCADAPWPLYEVTDAEAETLRQTKANLAKAEAR
jgi:hypothetical protein